MKKKEILDPNRFIYQLCINDVRSVIEEDGFDLELNEDLILHLEKISRLCKAFKIICP